MKANEAPEKIYKTVTYLDERKRGDVKWKDKPVAGAENIEYTRTDAFIKKACDWLIDNIHNYTDDGTGEHSFVIIKDFIKDFTNYMKGE